LRGYPSQALPRSASGAAGAPALLAVPAKESGNPIPF
jgi:hypothetical protein